MTTITGITSTIASSIDQLVALIGGLSVMTTYNASVHDGWPVNQESNFVVVGGAENNLIEDDQQAGGISFGGPYREENYTVQLNVAAWAGGTDQKAVRDIAFAIYAGIETALRANPTLNGTIRWAQVSNPSLMQTDAENAATGRYAEIVVGVNIVNRIWP